MSKKKKSDPSPPSLPAVFAEALVESEGTRAFRVVPMFQSLPGWWSQAQPDQRQLWLTEYFRRQLKLTDAELLLDVKCHGGTAR